jgi:hypothetical protein
MKFTDTVAALKTISLQLRKQGVTVENLDTAIKELAEHQSNIEKIEENIDAIKTEVISPLKAELEQNKMAGRFSIFGFWVGAIGLLVSIGTIFYQQNKAAAQPAQAQPAQDSTASISRNVADVLERLQMIERQLLFPRTLQVAEGEVFVDIYKRLDLESDGDMKIALSVEGVKAYPDKQSMKGSVKIYRGESVLGESALTGILTRIDGKHEPHNWYLKDVIAAETGDSLTVGNVKVTVVQLYSTEPCGRLVSDEKSGILFRVENGKSKNAPPPSAAPE